MMIASTVPVDDVLAAMARRRPVFHSEADMQHAFAWEAHHLDPDLNVRLETHPEPNVRLDLLLSRPDLNRWTAVELKYLTAAWTGEHSGEAFALKNHGAQDVRAYDVVKDISRLERFIGQQANWNGVFIAISNDSMYWRPTTHGRATNANAFRIYDGTTLSGVRSWGPRTGAGTMKSRTDPITLIGTHMLSWREYSRLPGPRGDFRALVVGID